MTPSEEELGTAKSRAEPGAPEELSRPALRPVRSVQPASSEADDEDDEGEGDDGEDEDLPVVFTTGEAVGAVATVLRFLMPHLAAHRVGLSLVGLGLLVETAFNVLMPLSLKYFIDEVAEGGDRREFVTVLVVLGVAGVVTSVTAVWYERRDAIVTAAIMADIRRMMFRRVQSLRAAYFARTKSGEIVSRFSSDLATVETGVVHAANWAVLPALELVAGIILLLFLSWELALVALLIFPIALLGPRLIAPRAIEASYELKRRQAAALGTVAEQISAQGVVKAFGLQRITRRWFGRRNDDVRKAMAEATFLTTMVERSVTISVLLLHLVVFGIGAWLTFNDVISLGAFVTFEGVFWEISYNIAHLMQFVPVTLQSAASVRHIEEVLSAPGEAPDREDMPGLSRLSRRIAFEDVRFAYDENAGHQFAGLSFAIDAGKRTAVVGPSGAGKSTVVNLLLRLYEPSGGRITFDGVDIASTSTASLRDQTAVVFQDSILFGASIRDNIRLGRPDATDAEVEAAAKAAEIHRFIIRMPAGYETEVGERGATLSGGQRQRIALARAVLRNPALLLLDEATSALDQSTEAAILRTLRRIGRGRTMVFVTHRLTTVTDFDEIIVMREGRVVQRGTHAELVAKKGLYRRLWLDQERTTG
jgi:ATP-binding cassette subfamily B protein